MKFTFLLFYKIQTWISLLLYFLSNSDFVVSQDEWMRINGVVYDGPHFVNEGQSFEILCKMSRFNAPKWTKNDSPLSKDNRFITKNIEDEQRSRIETIFVSNAILEDSGYYRCNSFSRESHRLDVIPIDSRNIMKEESKESGILFEEIKEENSSVSLECKNVHNSDNQRIIWYRNNVQIFDDQKRKIVGTKLMIERANSTHDAGDYMCKIDSITAMGGSLFGQLIQLRAPIKVIPLPGTINVLQNGTLTIECNYTGYPHGSISWAIGNEKLSRFELESRGIELRQNKKTQPNGVLFISKLKLSHSHSYTCIVNNGYTSHESSALVTVRESTVFTDDDSVTLVENKPLKISCNTTASDSNQEDLTWYRDGFIIEKSDTRVQYEDAQKKVLKIEKANKNDMGDYQCKLSSSEATIKVRTKPWLLPFEEYQKTNYKSANVIEGEKFSLKCEVMEDYKRDAQLIWVKYNESEHEDKHRNLVTIETDDRIKVETNGSKSILIIASIVPTDRFYYVCIANNSVATFNNTILLRVKDKLGALWPFLGIVGEVVILCTIIFIYEKRRMKPDFDESDNNDHNTEGKATQDRSSKAQDVRQRK